jgi:hypothetical protein
VISAAGGPGNPRVPHTSRSLRCVGVASVSTNITYSGEQLLGGAVALTGGAMSLSGVAAPVGGTVALVGGAIALGGTAGKFYLSLVCVY